MIPVRVPAGAMPALASERRFAAGRGHPLDRLPCPVCDGPLGAAVTVLVFVGIDPVDRKPGGFTVGGAVSVHAACAGVPEEEPAAPEAAGKPEMCPGGCGFRLGTDDADRRECGCDAACCDEGIAPGQVTP